MNAKEIAADFTKALAESGNGKVWAFVEAYMEKAIIAAVEEDRKKCPHQFVGRNDRDCEVCGNPDRDDIHLIPNTRLWNAVKQERQSCTQIADSFAVAWAAKAEKEKSPGLNLSLLARAEGARIIAEEIRARSNASRSVLPAEK